MQPIDLHSHSRYSDGSLIPADLVELAHINGVQMLALTDHDTVAGIPEACAKAKEVGLTLIPGVEISTRFFHHEIHVVALNIDPVNRILLEGLAKQTQIRIERAKEMAKGLEKIGIMGAYEGACLISGSEVVGRAHFAQFLVKEGHAPDFQTVFKRYLTRGKPGYVPSQWPPMEEILEWIQLSGGQSVLAHPARYKLTRQQLKHLLKSFKQAGGNGLEVVTSNHQPDETHQMAMLSLEFDLLASMGSDFHGEAISHASLGRLMPLPAICKPIWQSWSAI